MAPHIEPNADLINMLQVLTYNLFTSEARKRSPFFSFQPALLCLKYTENEIYELSLAREPRTSVRMLTFLELSFVVLKLWFVVQNTMQKPEVFADWAAGVTASLDSHTLDRHIQCMVEVCLSNQQKFLKRKLIMNK